MPVHVICPHNAAAAAARAEFVLSHSSAVWGTIAKLLLSYNCSAKYFRILGAPHVHLITMKRNFLTATHCSNPWAAAGCC